MIRLNKIMNKFERTFLRLLREDEEALCRYTFRTDKLGNRVEVPYGGHYEEGKNGRGVGIPKGHTAKEDNVGQKHDIPPGMVLKMGANGRGVVVCPNEPTSEKKGQIIVLNRKKPKMESRRPSCLDLLRWTKLTAEG